MTKPRLLFGLLIAATLVFAVAGPAASDEEPASPEDMMKLWQEYMTPGEHHKSLAYFVGSWDVESKVMMGSAEPVKGTAETIWLIDGLFIQTTQNSVFMGIPNKQVTTIGFDKFKKKWVASSLSSMGTGIIRGEGVVVDPTGKTVVL